MSTPESIDRKPAPMPVWAVFSISSVVILAAMAAVLIWLFKAPILNQYPIILALLSFALSTVACLLFAAHAEIKASLPIAVITASGPALVWVVTLVVVSHVAPPPRLGAQEVIAILRQDELGTGWDTFADWTEEIGKLRWAVLRDEAYHVRQALDTAYFVGSGKRKILNPRLHTLFVYTSDNKAMKLQHITGRKDNIAEIFLRGGRLKPAWLRAYY